MGRELRVTIVGDPSSLQRALRSASSSANGFGGAMRKAGKIAATAAVAAGAAITAGLVVTLKRGFDELAESQKVSAQTAAALKATGGVANVTAKEIEGLASQLSRLTGIDDEQIQANENLLLTFKNVRNEVGKNNDIFNRATQASLDLSTAGFGSLDSAAKMLGKALNDPVKGMTAMGRAGVTFSEEQKKAIAALVESGDVLEAQKLILAEVESQVGGSAKAYGETLPGQLAKARNAFDEVAGQVAARFLPMLTSVLDWVNQHWPEIEAVINAGATAITATFRAIGTTATWLRGQWEIHRDTVVAVWAAVQAAAQRVAAWFEGTIVPAFQNAAATISAIWRRFGDEISDILNSQLGAAFRMAKVQIENFISSIEIILAVLRGDWSTAWEELKGIVTRTLSSVADSVRGMASNFLTAAKALGKAIKDGIVAGITGLVDGVGEKIAWLWSWLRTEGVDLATEAAKNVGKAILSGIWEGLKDLVTSDAIEKEVAKVITNASQGSGAADKGAQIGSQFLSAIAAAIAAQHLAIARAIAADIASVFEHVRQNVGSTPQEVGRDKFGKPWMQGIGDGIVWGTPFVSERARESVRTVVREAARAAREAAAERWAEIRSAFESLASAAMSAFEASWASWKPPSLRLLEKMRLEDQIKAVTDRVAEAQAELARLMAESAAASQERQTLGTEPPPGMDPEEWKKRVAELDAIIKNNGSQILAAQAEVDAALRAQTEFNLEQQAIKEQEAHDKQMAQKKSNLQAFLNEQWKFLQEHPRQWARVHRRIMERFRSEFGPDFRTAGKNMGTAFAEGMANALDAMESAAEKLARMIAKYLKTASPTELGPMSDLDKWAKGLVPAYMKGVDFGAMRRTFEHGLPGMAAASGPGTATAASPGRTLILKPSDVKVYLDRRQIALATNEERRVMTTRGYSMA